MVVLTFFFLLQFNMDRANAEEFFEVYKGVVTEYTVSIESGDCRGKKRSLWCLLFFAILQIPFTYVSW